MYLDINYERAMIYHLVVNRYNCKLDEEDFTDIMHKEILKRVNKLRFRSEEVSILAVSNKNKRILKYLSEIEVYGTSAEETYNKIKQLSNKRKMFKLLQETQKQLETEENIYNITEKMIKQMNMLNQDITEKTYQEKVFNALESIENNIKNKDNKSLYTGLTELDTIICGLHRQELTIIGARPGTGKTTLALQIAENIAHNGLKVGFISLEMSAEQIITKIISRHSGINSHKMRMGYLNDKEVEDISKTAMEISMIPIELIEKCRTIQDIEQKARYLKNRKRLDVLIIDYIQLIKSTEKFNIREQEVADISRTLKMLTLELDIPIIALCQLNRNAQNNVPTLADLRESGSLEQDADNVMFLYKAEAENEVILNVAKQRAGITGQIKLYFNKGNSEFINLGGKK